MSPDIPIVMQCNITRRVLGIEVKYKLLVRNFLHTKGFRPAYLISTRCTEHEWDFTTIAISLSMEKSLESAKCKRWAYFDEP
jgi:hypothetical protein